MESTLKIDEKTCKELESYVAQLSKDLQKEWNGLGSASPTGLVSRIDAFMKKEITEEDECILDAMKDVIFFEVAENME